MGGHTARRRPITWVASSKRRVASRVGSPAYWSLVRLLCYKRTRNIRTLCPFCCQKALSLVAGVSSRPPAICFNFRPGATCAAPHRVKSRAGDLADTLGLTPNRKCARCRSAGTSMAMRSWPIMPPRDRRSDPGFGGDSATWNFRKMNARHSKHCTSCGATNNALRKPAIDFAVFYAAG